MCYVGALEGLDEVKEWFRISKEISTEILQGILRSWAETIWSLSSQQTLSTYYVPFLYYVLELNKFQVARAQRCLRQSDNQAIKIHNGKYPDRNKYRMPREHAQTLFKAFCRRSRLVFLVEVFFQLRIKEEVEFIQEPYVIHYC